MKTVLFFLILSFAVQIFISCGNDDDDDASIDDETSDDDDSLGNDDDDDNDNDTGQETEPDEADDSGEDLPVHDCHCVNGPAPLGSFPGLSYDMR